MDIGVLYNHHMDLWMLGHGLGGNVIILSLISSAYPCAGLFHEEGKLAKSDAQHVVFSQDGGSTIVEYLVQYSGDAKSFGWVIPIFGEFQNLQDGDSSRFEDLISKTQPKVVWQYDNDDYTAPKSCACRRELAMKGSFNAGAGDTGTLSNVAVITEGFTGTYEYTVLDADDGESLTAWLDTNGWSVGSTGPSLDAYAAEDDVYFIAIGLQEMPEDAEDGYLPPLEIVYDGDSMRFPAIMGRYAGTETMRTIVFLEGDEKATVSGWSAVEEPVLEGDVSDDPEEVFTTWLTDIGGVSPTFGLVISLKDTNAWVTRYESITYPEANAVDPSFHFDGGNDLNADSSGLVIQLNEQENGWLFLPLVIGLGTMRRRRVRT